MYEGMLLESGKMFEGSRVSGVGADVIDDTEDFTVPATGEGKADIVSITKPSTFTPGVSFPVGVVIKNIGAFADMLFVRLTNIDTGENLGFQQIYLNAGQTGTALSFILNLTQTTDFHGRVEAGHVE